MGLSASAYAFVNATSGLSVAAMNDEAQQSTFQVDLRGLVDLLSHHLYSSPRLYGRELLQNGVDAVTARGGLDSRLAVLLTGADVSADGRMHCFNSGTGLDADDIGTFLATIGRSSKRGDLGEARADLLGQFGIGPLSAFLVTDEIEVVSRKGDGPVARWRGRADGSALYREVGEGLELAKQLAYALASHVRGEQKAQQELDAWLAEPRTSASDCEACQRSTRTSHYRASGRRHSTRRRPWSRGRSPARRSCRWCWALCWSRC